MGYSPPPKGAFAGQENFDHLESEMAQIRSMLNEYGLRG
jgi:hypothetical protein